MAINPEFFEEGFETRLQDLMNYCRNMEPVRTFSECEAPFFLTFNQITKVDPEKPVLVPGDPEKHQMELNDRNGAISYHPNQVKMAYDLAQRLNIQPPKILGDA
jgi:LDH2 family malate/lactate/ureidoglycolate dehydrogenase